MDSIAAELLLLGQESTIQNPIVRLERATKEAPLAPYDGNCVSMHLCDSIYFRHAVKRLSNDYPDGL